MKPCVNSGLLSLSWRCLLRPRDLLSLHDSAALVQLLELLVGEGWSLDHLDLRDEHVLDLHDRLALLDDVALDGLVDDLLAEVGDRARLGGLAHQLDALVPDLAALALLRVARLLRSASS